MEANELLGIGPTVAIVDDKETEIRSLKNELTRRNIGNEFFEVDALEPKFPEQTLNTIKLIFLDLYYDTNFGSRFEPTWCIDWIQKIIPEGHIYSLVVWSKDKDLTSVLLKSMEEINAPMPFFVDTKWKTEYIMGNEEYDVDRLLGDLNTTAEKAIEIDRQEYFGQIIEIDEKSILINCLIYENPATFEVRRFDLKPFKNYINIEVGKYILIKVTTKPREKTFEFSEEFQDLSKAFIKSDDFENIDTSFLTDIEDDDDNYL